MTKVKRLIVATFCTLGFCNLQTEVNAQTTVSTDSTTQTPADTLPARWDLQTCINYALNHNITIQRNRISVESSEEDLKTSKSALFPRTPASASV